MAPLDTGSGGAKPSGFMKKNKAELTSEECIQEEEETMKNTLLCSSVELERRLRQYTEASQVLIRPAIKALKEAYQIENAGIEAERRIRRDRLEKKEISRYHNHKS